MARGVTRQQLARRGILVLVGIVLVGVLVSLRSNGTFGQSPHVTAEVATAGGALRKGSDVKMNGVIVGKVSRIARADDGAVSVDMEMSEEDLGHVPANVVARILPATVFGTTYVDLVVHGEGSSDHLEAGDVVQPDRTQSTLELQQALDDIDRLTKALGPKELASAIGSAADALDGRGGQLNASVRTINSYLDRINGRMPAIRSDLEGLATTSDVLDEVAPGLLDATDDSLVFLHTVVTQEAALTSLISGGTALAETADRFLTRNQRDLVAWINDTGRFVDAIYDNRRAGITDAVTVNLAAGRVLQAAVDHGFVKTDGVMRTDLPPYYASRPTYARSTGPSDAGLSAIVGDGQ
ncbi:MAG TPA: MCE family protein [Nocardioides sp.]|nr:MCE family protein [Nocardioides sp.]